MTSRRDFALALCAGLATLTTYLLSLAPTVLPGDSGEFQFAAPLLGLAHPTGYPLYLILGKLWTTLVPIGDAAYRMNLFSAVLSAAAVAGLFILGRRLGLSLGPAAVAALTLAVSRTFWSQAVRAEVYALNSLFTAILFVLAMRVDLRGLGDLGGLRGLDGRYALPFVFGLALAHHRMVLLLIPALALIALSSSQPAASGSGASAAPKPETRNPRPSALHPILYALLLLVPLLLYLYIPLRAAATPYLRLAVGGGPELVVYENTPADFVAMITGSVFRGSLGLSEDASLSGRLALAADLLRQQVGLVGMALAVIGLLSMLRQQTGRALGFVLAYVAVVGFCLLYAIGDIADLFTQSYIVVALWVGAGVEATAQTSRRLVGAVAARRLHWPARAPAVFVTLMAAALPLALLAGNWPSVDLSAKTGVRAGWEIILSEPLPAGAALVSNDRDDMTPMWYLQYVEGKRRDLVGLFPKIKPGDEFSSLGALLDWLLARGQKPYLIKPMPGLEVKYDIAVAGPLAQVVGRGADQPLRPARSSGANFAGVVTLLGADVQGTPSAGGSIGVTLYWTPATPPPEDYHTFVQLLTAAGERVAGSDQRVGGVFYPTSVWAVGDVLADRHTLALPATAPAGVYHLRAGLYSYPSLVRLRLTGSNQTLADLGTIEIR